MCRLRSNRFAASMFLRGRPMCTHDRSQFREKRVHFESMFANNNVRDFF